MRLSTRSSLGRTPTSCRRKRGKPPEGEQSHERATLQDTNSTPPGTGPGRRGATREITGYWWIWLVTGIGWIVISLVLLQFDAASITTVSILVGPSSSGPCSSLRASRTSP
jgi:hypothetical protein